MEADEIRAGADHRLAVLARLPVRTPEHARLERIEEFRPVRPRDGDLREADLLHREAVRVPRVGEVVLPSTRAVGNEPRRHAETGTARGVAFPDDRPPVPGVTDVLRRHLVGPHGQAGGVLLGRPELQREGNLRLAEADRRIFRPRRRWRRGESRRQREYGKREVRHQRTSRSAPGDQTSSSTPVSVTTNRAGMPSVEPPANEQLNVVPEARACAEMSG